MLNLNLMLGKLDLNLELKCMTIIVIRSKDLENFKRFCEKKSI